MYLNCHSYFSFRYGTLSIERLLDEAIRCNISKLALTDINNTSGILDFISQCDKRGINPIAGIDFRNGTQQQFIGIAKNEEGFFELNHLLTQCLAGGEKALVPKYAPELNNAFVIYPLHNIPEKLRENEFIGVRLSQIHQVLFSPLRNRKEKLLLLAPVTFRNGNCMNSGASLHKRDFNIHRLLQAVDKNTLLTKINPEDLSNQDEVMIPENEMEKSCALLPEILTNAKKMIEQCSIHLPRGVNRNKKFFTGNANDDYELLHDEAYRGLEYRYGDASYKVVERMKKELEDVRRLGYTAYFLISWDIVRYARNRGFFYVGRGSGANSILAYCLQITDVDPIDLDLYFERFINPYRTSPPDFDLDFSWKERDEIIEYIFKKHGKEHTALLATYSTFQFNAVVRELGKVFGLPKQEIDELAQNGIHTANDNAITRAIVNYSKHIHEFPNHLSIHAGGILISEKPMNYYTALSMPPKGFPLTQFSMLEAEDFGLYKFDILSQRGLGHIRDTVEIVKQNRGEHIDIHDIARFKTDKKIANLIRNGRCMGCFYVESPAMRMLLKKLRCEDYITLVAASSIIRPGVSQSGMMREYIERFHDPSRMDKTPPQLLNLLKETYGVMVFQEDVIKVAHYFAGLTLAEADILRRGMSGKFRSREEFQKIKEKFFSNCEQKKYSQELSAEVWRQIESFAGYSFSKGHSASYAVESYQSLFLKAYYPLEFMVGVINNFGGFYRTEYYVHEARMSGANIHAPCVNHSFFLTSIKGKDIYLGMGLIAQLGEKLIQSIEREREHNGKFLSLENFVLRVKTGPEQLRTLIRANALRFTGMRKKELLWEMLSLPGMAQTDSKKKYEGTEALFESESKKFSLPHLDYGTFDDVMDEIELLGFPLCSPFSLLPDSSKYNFTASMLEVHLGKTIEIAGYYVTCKPTHTTKGELMMFGTLLDKEGFFFDTTHFPKIIAQYPFRGKGIYLIKGKVVNDFGFLSVDVFAMEKLQYAFGMK
ncbi:MAG: DNA polymerase III subunit alpha [Bacteroidota bacterium]|jgi:DNA-directed DNA polymerase III PolC